MSQEIKMGSVIGFDGASGDHGCRDHCIARVVGIKDGYANVVIVEAMSCTSCWQVGHDHDHVFAEENTYERWSLERIVYVGDDDELNFSADVPFEFFPRDYWRDRIIREPFHK